MLREFVLQWDSSWPILRTVLDILVVSYLLYKFMLIVKGTRAMPMLAGLGIVILVFVLSEQLGLATLAWILGNFLGSVILVIVVLFQEDLRRALIKVGLGPSFGGAESSNVAGDSIDEICKAVGELTARRLGAIIVIQREIGLEDYTEQAVELNAKLSQQLLVSVFLPTSPLHDGAVVVRGDTVLVASAVLPLSFLPQKSASYGTRHRAALGLSERSDALVVVISEETGAISLVREGRITRDLTQKSLSQALYRLLVVREQKKKGRKKGGWFGLVRGASVAKKPEASEQKAEKAASS